MHSMIILLLLAGILNNVSSLPVSYLAKRMNHGHETSTIISTAHGSVLGRDEFLVSDNGLCGVTSSRTCKNSLFGDSCSEWGFCGSYYTVAYAGPGCQPAFGICNPDLASSSSETRSNSIVAPTMAQTSTAQTPTELTSTAPTATQSAEQTNIVIVPVTTTVVEAARSPTETVSGRFGFCGLKGSSC